MIIKTAEVYRYSEGKKSSVSPVSKKSLGSATVTRILPLPVSNDDHFVPQPVLQDVHCDKKCRFHGGGREILERTRNASIADWQDCCLMDMLRGHFGGEF